MCAWCVRACACVCIATNQEHSRNHLATLWQPSRTPYNHIAASVFLQTSNIFIFLQKICKSNVCLCLQRSRELSVCSDKHYSRLPAGRGLGRDPPVSDLPEAQREHRGWAGGFCSPACMEDFQLRSNQGYMRARVLETEQGVCQHCGLNAHQLSGTPRTHTARKYWTTPGWHSSLTNRLGSFLGASSAYFAILASFFLSILSIYLMLKYYMLKLLKHFNVHFLGVLFLLKCNAQ